jgi:hypothetical protein
MTRPRESCSRAKMSTPWVASMYSRTLCARQSVGSAAAEMRKNSASRGGLDLRGSEATSATLAPAPRMNTVRSLIGAFFPAAPDVGRCGREAASKFKRWNRSPPYGMV